MSTLDSDTTMADARMETYQNDGRVPEGRPMVVWLWIDACPFGAAPDTQENV